MLLLKVFEIIGTIAFAISGALVGMQKKLDLFGVTFLGIITAVGGGIFRDIILGNTPPTAFVKPNYCFISIITSISIFYLYPRIAKKYKKYTNKNVDELEMINKYTNMTKDQILRLINKQNQMITLKRIILISDAIGLATFTAVGSNLAFYNVRSNLFLVVCMGFVTGVGGGILRDTFVQDTPLIFRKEIYAVASIIGGISFYVCKVNKLNYMIAFYLCFTLTFVSRMIAMKLNLNLPKFNSDKYKIRL